MDDSAGRPVLFASRLDGRNRVRLLNAPPSSHNTLAIYQHLGLVPRVTHRPTSYELTRALVGRGMGYALLVQRPTNDRTYEGYP
jgi:hypothetical protein